MNRTHALSLLSVGVFATTGIACSGDDPIVVETNDPIEFSTTSLPGGQEGQPYSAEISAKGGSGEGYRWSVIGSLPAGLFMSSRGTVTEDGDTTTLMTTILGTPQVNGDYSFTVRLSDGDGDFQSADFTITLGAPPPALEIVTETLPDGGTETAYDAQLEATNGTTPYTWTLVGGALPPGLTLSTSGALTGMPADAGDFSFSVRVSDSEGASASADFTVAVQDESLPLGMVTTDLPDGVVELAYTAQLEGENGSPPYTWSIIGDSPPGLELAAEGNPVTLSGTPELNGSYTFQIEVEDSEGARVRRTFFVEIARAPPPLRIVTLNLPSGEVNTPYNATITGVNGSGAGYTWRVSQGALPGGLTLAASGTPDTTLSGNPTQDGSFTFTVEITDDASRTFETEYTVDIIPEIFPVAITSTVPAGQVIVLPSVRLGETYNQTITAENGFGNYNWIVSGGSLPAGLSVEVAGTPSSRVTGLAGQRGTFTFTVTVYDSNNDTASRDFQLFVDGPEFPVNIVTTNVPNGLACNGFNAEIVARQGSNVDYQWTVSAGSLPPGIVLDPTGTPSTRLRGTPSTAAAGSYSFTVTVSDSAGDSFDVSYTMSVVDDGTGDRWLAMAGDGTIDNRNDIFMSNICDAVPGAGVQVSPPGTTGDADTGSTDFAISPDGTKVAFIGDFRQVGIDEVWVVDLSGAAPTAPVIVSPPQTSSSYDAFDLKWGPNGNRLAFLGDMTRSSVNEVYVVDTSGTIVANSAVPVMPTSMPSFSDVDSQDYWFSKNGSYLAIKADTFSSSAYELWVSNLTTLSANNAVRVSDPLPSTSVDVNEPIIWANDTQVMYNGDFNTTFQDEMWLVDMTQTVIAPRRLNAQFPTSSGDCWFGTNRYGITGDGRYAWWTSDLRATFVSYELYAVDLTNPTAVGQMVHPPMASSSNDFWGGESEPNGSKVAMYGPGIVSGRYEMFVFDLAGTYPQPLLDARANGPMQPNGDIFSYTDIEWSPDGNWIGYTADQIADGHDACFVVDVSSQPYPEAVEVSPPTTNGSLDAFNIYWSADSSKVAFQGDLRLSSVNEILISDVSSGTPSPGVFVNAPISGSQDVDVPFVFKPDGSGVFYRSDAVTAFQDRVWYVDLGGPTPAAPVEISPTGMPVNGDIFYIKGQGM